MTAAAVLGLLVLGGAGFAMGGGADVITGISHATFIHTRTTVHTVFANAANDQYGTTTTTVSTTTTAGSGTTTSSDGTQSTQVSGTGGGVTVAPPTDGNAQTSVNWAPGTFPGTVDISVDPTPAVAAPAFVGPASDQIVSITVTDPKTGQIVHTLSGPLEIVFKNPPKNYVPAFSDDGVNFRALSCLPARRFRLASRTAIT